MLKFSIVLFAVVAAAHANTYYGYAKEFPNVAVHIPTNIAADNEEVPINREWQTIVLVHGHAGDLESESNQMMKREILKYRDANVIIVDWSASSKLSYSNAAGAVPGVGRLLAEFLITLESQKEIVEDDNVDDISDNPLYYDNAIKIDVKTIASRIESQGIGRIQFSNLHLVGFNLGAHVVGHAAREITLRTGARVARITGLDPSRSQWGSGSSRLARTDATYVEVIHTDGDGLLSNGLGTAVGDVDFFVNGGSNQPGCLTHACSHNRAYELFAGTFARAEKLYGYYCATNLQLTLNRCGSQRLYVGDETLDKSVVYGIYRVNTGRIYPY